MDATADSNVDNRRKHRRFSDRLLAGAVVELKPCPPLFGDTVSGYLTDLSAGGMAILIPDLIPRKVFLRMTLTLPDGYKLESVVTVRHIAKQGQNDYLHGLEFLNPSPEMIQHVEAIAVDILACNDRTKNQAKEICVDSCVLRQICKRPQCVEKNIRPAIIALTKQPHVPELESQNDWDSFKEKFKKFLNAA